MAVVQSLCQLTIKCLISRCSSFNSRPYWIVSGMVSRLTYCQTHTSHYRLTYCQTHTSHYRLTYCQTHTSHYRLTYCQTHTSHYILQYINHLIWLVSCTFLTSPDNSDHLPHSSFHSQNKTEPGQACFLCCCTHHLEWTPNHIQILSKSYNFP